MKRARVSITEFTISKKGQVHHFEIKLPKNTTQILAVETDCRIGTTTEKTSPQAEAVASPKMKISAVVPKSALRTYTLLEGIKNRNTLPFLIWTNSKIPTLGKLKLQSLEKANIFFEDWVKFRWLNGGIDDMSFGLFPVNPYSLNKNTVPKIVNVPNTTTVINGLFTDTMGQYFERELKYSIKVFVWVETEEESKGVDFDFQKDLIPEK